ncbi:hypothetical protein G7Y89_g4570 [Cudoniella acicularis]|uniref:Uncharacterized protein n=1 Tax=Cudoniella acicularis TaxID=354080 RepID=A0A8H4W458_9HELO|nr:hypothetical protein G7Y89_g4570 [Cudoniella acicularis]
MAIHSWPTNKTWDKSLFPYSHWVWLNRRRMKMGPTLSEQDIWCAYACISPKAYQHNVKAASVVTLDRSGRQVQVVPLVKPENGESQARRATKKQARGAQEVRRKRGVLSRRVERRDPNPKVGNKSYYCNGEKPVSNSESDSSKIIPGLTSEAEDPTLQVEIERISRKDSTDLTRGFRLGAQIQSEWFEQRDEDDWIDVNDESEDAFEILDQDFECSFPENEYVFL